MHVSQERWVYMDSKLNHILLLHDAAHVDYSHYFLKLYIAFNAWYRVVTGKRKDRDALQIVFHEYGSYWGDKAGWRQTLYGWYELRCVIVHGGEVSNESVRASYRTLKSYMARVCEDLRASFDVSVAVKMDVISALLNQDEQTMQSLRQMYDQLSAKNTAK